METESASAPQSPQITGSRPASFDYSKRLSRLDFGDSVKKIRPFMVRLGELLEAIFLATPDSPLQKSVDLTMRFIFSYIKDLGDYELDLSIDTRIKLYRDFVNNPFYANKTWRDLCNEALFYYDLPLGMSIIQLQEYAYDGVGPSDDYGVFDDIVEREEYVRRLLQLTKPAVATLGVGTSEPATHGLITVLLAAEARLALDEGRDVTPEQLAALRRIETKSMRNALAPSSGSGLKMRNGAITAESALNWLHACGKYKSTLWREDEEGPEDEPIAGEVLFVPFASDNIEFHPVACLREGKYMVGPNGAEQIFTDYRAALDCLARMKPAAYWKHPNTANNWRTVTAVGFRPRSALELGLEPAEGAEK
jgi:hypothetical protein